MAKIKGKIDPGHSLNTKGKRAGNYREYKSNRNVAAKLVALLNGTGHFDVSLTLDPNDAWDMPLEQRAANAVRAGAAFFCSIHSNAHDDEDVRGTETFIHTNSSASQAFAQEVQSHLVGSLGTKNRGVKRANFGVLRGTYQHMLAILTEGEFYTNPAARAWMLTEDYENRYADGVARGICDFYNVKYTGKTAPAAPKTPPVIQTDDVGSIMVSVKAKDLYTYNSPDWNDKGPIVHKDEAFTVTKKLNVDGGIMYKLKSGLYITANPEYVELVGKVSEAKPEDKPDLVIVDVADLYTYKSKDWNDKGPIVHKGDAFTVTGSYNVDGGTMYKLKSGLYITANPDYVTYKKR